MGPTYSIEAATFHGVTFPAGDWFAAYFARGDGVEATHTSEAAARAAFEQLGAALNLGAVVDMREGRIRSTVEAVVPPEVVPVEYENPDLPQRTEW